MPPSEVRRWAPIVYPHPGRWDFHYRRNKTYYLGNLVRYRRVRKLWKAFPRSVKSAILRSRKYSDRMAIAYPDYFVLFGGSTRKATVHGFVEVKGFGEKNQSEPKAFLPRISE